MSRAALVVGGAGALGRALASALSKRSWEVFSVDARPKGDHGQDKSSHRITLGTECSLKEQLDKIQNALPRGCKFHAIYCVAGGFLAGDLGASDNLSDSVSKLWKMNVESSLLAAVLARDYLSEGGLLVLTGAASALEGTPAMIGYGIAKAAVHQLVKSVSLSPPFVASSSKVVALLPTILDTLGNREAMPRAGFENWTPLPELAETLVGWADHAVGGKGKASMGDATGVLGIHSGDFIKVETVNGATHYTKVQL